MLLNESWNEDLPNMASKMQTRARASPERSPRDPTKDHEFYVELHGKEGAMLKRKQ